MSPKLSVIVPFHNEEVHLEECLESLARQTLRDLEVILVDDGSTDGGAVHAKTMAERDERFVLLHQDNSGAGAARNRGARLAKGEFLAFADAHDVVVGNAYELLIGSLEKTGSDLACGNVLRLESGRTSQSRAHREAFEAGAQKTHITRTTALLRDRRVWNKVYRRSFWDEQGLSFGDGLHTDGPVSARAHVLASSVDVLESPVYWWRKVAASPADKRNGAVDLEDRMASVHAVCDLLGERAPKLRRTYHKQVIRRELDTLVKKLPKTPEDEQRALLELGAAFVERADRGAIGQLKAFERLWVHLLGHRQLPELLEVMAPDDRAQILGAPVTRRGVLKQRWYARYPFFEDGFRGIPRSVYEVTEELEFRGKVDSVVWHEGRLRISGYAYIDRLDMASTDDGRITLWLQDTRRGVRIPLEPQRSRRPDVTAASNQPTACYDGSGFVVEVDPSAFEGHRRRTGEWELHTEVVVQGAKRGGCLSSSADQQNAWLPALHEADDIWIQPVARGDGFSLRVRPIKALVTAHRVVDGTIVLEGRTVDASEAPVELVAAARQADFKVTGPVECSPRSEGGGSFRAELPLQELVAAHGHAGPAALTEWEIRLRTASGTIKPLLAAEAAEGRYPAGALEVALTRTRYGNLLGMVRPCALVATSVTWDGDRITVAGDYAGEGTPPAELILRHGREAEEYGVPLTWTGGHFRASFKPGEMPALGAPLPLAPGTWELRADTGTSEGSDADVAVLLERAAVPDLPPTKVVGAHEVSVVPSGGALRLRVRLALADDERGLYAQERLRKDVYPRLCSEPLRDLVVFDAYMARQYSCNPRAIYEELVRQRTDLDCVWVSRDGQFRAPHGARTVLVGSKEHYTALAHARYIVGNEAQQPWFDKRPDQTYVQCWHGTPLKRLALDVPALPHMRKATLGWVRREVPRWDVLLSPNPFTSPIMRKAYQYGGEILESGYPRNDLLQRPEAPQVAAEVRRRLGIPEGKRVVLYVPTWRDDLYFARGRRAFELALDLDRARAVLGPDHVLLLRTHYLVTDRSWSQVDDFVVDVSRYPDIAELYLAADVLVTDYSSAMFDFAVTGKPMVFFTYDLEKYRDKVRGFYFDFEAEAPGPLLRTSDETIAALRDMDGAAQHPAYGAFVDKFCPYDDGHAAERVIQRMFELGEA
ncbi:CDP-glycerol glycerophosphotransferase family protein [Actinomadura barringtoniae]|uniref:CDP-glycerol glycerophosphotransferase family protein n=1 Tax=Actinomadura barringtoniae TaxID=1427535 RepID=A0A939PH81_9ACTN|nr:bifunctional glycosyltransferase/CDP-glycerol:glycerophosphate glycerophosphotransferase [Actinomadura barringtoniae]MBO2452188.1 CDP-glycerol glycerophosphotransferase family protein [Actinomadura barringtoniae]